MMHQEGVLLVAHGTVSNEDELVEFLTAIRRGRPPGDELVRQMQHRYRTIGGSPLLSQTAQQARALSARIERPVLIGMRFGRPSLEAALAEAAQLGIRRLLTLPMAPYSAALYCDEVIQRQAAASVETRGLELVGVPAWGEHPGLVRAHADWIRHHASAAMARGATVVLSAHSLPMRVIESGDRYGIETARSAAAISAMLGTGVRLAYQSRGADGGHWLGPDLDTVLREIAELGQSEVVVVPFGFLCEHVETLYDLDVEARAYTISLGLQMTRVPTLGSSPRLIETMAELVAPALGASVSPLANLGVPSCRNDAS